MNKLEQLHLEAIDDILTSTKQILCLTYQDRKESSSKSAEITEKIAIEFTKFCFNKAKDLDIHYNTMYIESMFQEFIKTKVQKS